VVCELPCAGLNFVDGWRGGGAGRCRQRRAVISQREKRHRRPYAGRDKGREGAVAEGSDLCNSSSWTSSGAESREMARALHTDYTAVAVAVATCPAIG
jgi:hypothetical protein